MVADALEASRVQPICPGLWLVVVKGGAQLAGDTEAVRTGRRQVGQAKLGREARGEQSPCGQEVLGQDGEPAGDLEERSNGILGEVGVPVVLAQ